MKPAEEIGLNTRCPDTKRLTNEQLQPMLRALKLAICRTAEAFYQYAHAPDELSPQMRALFHAYVPTKDEDLSEHWMNALCGFDCMTRPEFDQFLKNAMKRMEGDPKFRIYANDIQGYSVTLPRADALTEHRHDEEFFYQDVLYVCHETLLKDAADTYANRFKDGDGVFKTCIIPARECDFVQFETLNGLCYFLNLCNPLMPHFSPKMLQATRQ